MLITCKLPEIRFTTLGLGSFDFLVVTIVIYPISDNTLDTCEITDVGQLSSYYKSEQIF